MSIFLPSEHINNPYLEEKIKEIANRIGRSRNEGIKLRYIDISELTEEQIKELANYINEMLYSEENLLGDDQYIQLLGRLWKYLDIDVRDRSIILDGTGNLVIDRFLLGAINMALLFVIKKDRLIKEENKK